jgi:hypothetical protein
LELADQFVVVLPLLAPGLMTEPPLDNGKEKTA